MARARKSVEDFIFKGEKTGLVQVVFLTDIQLPQYQPRQYFDEAKLEELAQTIKTHGILEPLLVRQLPRTNQYELVAGGRRYRAAKRAGLTEVPVIIKELTQQQALEVAIIENLQREDLNPVEETEGILQLIAIEQNLEVEEVKSRLYRLYNEVKGNVNESNPNVRVNQFEAEIEAVFNSLAKMNWQSYVKNRLPLLKLPEDVLMALREGKIEYTKAKAIARIKDEDARQQLLEEAIANSLSLSQIRERVKAVKPVKQREELRSRVDDTYKRLKQTKQLWQDSKKRQKLESLLLQLDKLIESESFAETFRDVKSDSRNFLRGHLGEKAGRKKPATEISKTSLEPIFEPVESEPDTEAEVNEELSDRDLAEVLGVSNLILAEIRQKQKKPPEALAKKLKQWEVRGDRWIKKL